MRWWLQAGAATGLRPREWQRARWADESQSVLLVPTEKTRSDAPARLQHQVEDRQPQQATAHPDMRSIPVETTFDRLAVASHLRQIEQAAKDGVDFEAYLEYARKALWRACRQLWAGKQNYTLEDASRHGAARDAGEPAQTQHATSRQQPE